MCAASTPTVVQLAWVARSKPLLVLGLVVDRVKGLSSTCTNALSTDTDAVSKIIVECVCFLGADLDPRFGVLLVC